MSRTRHAAEHDQYVTVLSASPPARFSNGTDAQSGKAEHFQSTMLVVLLSRIAICLPNVKDCDQTCLLICKSSCASHNTSAAQEG